MRALLTCAAHMANARLCCCAGRGNQPNSVGCREAAYIATSWSMATYTNWSGLHPIHHPTNRPYCRSIDGDMPTTILSAAAMIVVLVATMLFAVLSADS